MFAIWNCLSPSQFPEDDGHTFTRNPGVTCYINDNLVSSTDERAI